MSLLCRKKGSLSQNNVCTFLHYIFSEGDDPLGMKHKAVIKTNIAFKIKNNFVEFITFNILNEYQDTGREVSGREVSFDKITRTPELIKQGVPL
jgi:hypothetical protein